MTSAEPAEPVDAEDAAQPAEGRDLDFEVTVDGRRGPGKGDPGIC